MDERYNAKRISERAEPCPTPMSTLKKEKKSHSKDIWFFYLLDSFGRRLRFWVQSWL